MASDWQELLELLREPTAAYRPAMFWLLNGELTAERMREQIAQMHERGCGGFFLHPMGENFRLEIFISGMKPPYLSDEYFELIRVAVEEAAGRGMYAWLYDEGGWPSGDAQGKVVEGHPEFRGHVLRPGGKGEPVAEVEVGGRRLQFVAGVGGYPVDTLKAAAVRRFIEVTHERYAEHVGEFFGTTIPGIFTDEVRVGGQVGTAEVPWTDGMLAEFERRRGFDLTEYLPILFSDEALGLSLREHFSEGEIAAIRCEYSDFWTDLFEEAYWRQIDEWCAEHNLIHTGHVGGEDNLPDHVRGRFGHYFKTAGALHAPGVDVIWRQIFSGQNNFSFPQLASSALAQRGEKAIPGSPEWTGLVPSESFAVYGFGFTPEQMRWVADYQFVRGVNYIAPMALYYDTSGGHFIGTMSHLGEGNPLWDWFDQFADHAARMSAAVRETDPVADVAVYYPIEAAWLGGEALDAAWESLRRVTDALHSHQVAFDFIDGRTMAAATVEDGYLATPGQFYGSIIVPETPVLPAAVVERLAELRTAGGRVAFCGELPALAADLRKSDSFEAAMSELAFGMVEMDAARARTEMGADDPRGLGTSGTAALDGFTAAYMGASQVAQFTDGEVAESACLLVPPDEVERLAAALWLVHGRFEVQPEAPLPDLRIASRVCGEAVVHLLHNEGTDDLDARLMVINDQPRVIERWDRISGVAEVTAVHEYVAEPTYFNVNLRPGASMLLTTRPLSGEAPSVKPEPVPRKVRVTTGAEGLDIISQWVINTEGAPEMLEGGLQSAETPSDFPLQPLEEMGLSEFSGEVRYKLCVEVPEKYVDEELLLDLGEVGFVAAAWLNGQALGRRAWPPYRFDITDLAHAGTNDLTVQVTNTLANQAVREEVVQMAKDRGWFNSYYERALPWMRESLRSGLIGPVTVRVVVD